MFFLIDIFNVKEWKGFMIIYGVWYAFLYFIQAKFVFQANHSPLKLIKFIIFLVVFYVSANLLFNLLITYNLHYLISTFITVGILMPIRFLVSKNVVFK
ncbi:MAG: hypothetical protein CL526_00835 [Aequorivita sp.]|nr:hypothetical protein [Aequorivita sp.]